MVMVGPFGKRLACARSLRPGSRGRRCERVGRIGRGGRVRAVGATAAVGTLLAAGVPHGCESASLRVAWLRIRVVCISHGCESAPLHVARDLSTAPDACILSVYAFARLLKSPTLYLLASERRILPFVGVLVSCLELASRVLCFVARAPVLSFPPHALQLLPVLRVLDLRSWASHFALLRAPCSVLRALRSRFAPRPPCGPCPRFCS